MTSPLFHLPHPSLRRNTRPQVRERQAEIQKLRQALHTADNATELLQEEVRPPGGTTWLEECSYLSKISVIPLTENTLPPQAGA